ncbi:MAG: fimbrillin family protein [Bacteroidales bacterium]|nr:fimbrillin family protein [Bacteroidales bacterium]
MKILSSVLALSWLASCSSDTTITDIPDYEEHDPLTFSVASSSTSVSRAASHELEQGFLVSTYKLYGAASQQTVMDRYEALYNVGPLYNGSKWNTVGTAGSDPATTLYQTQYERYWDLSAFPYRFHAITPCPKQASVNALITGFELSDKELIIPGQYDDDTENTEYITYQSQKVTDGVADPAYVADPYMIAQVERDADGTDWDLLQAKFDADGNLTSTKSQINVGGSTTLTRAVPLTFHHINSKVRFAIFTTVSDFPVEALDIKNVRITAKNPKTQWKKFITQAAEFSATDNFFDKGKYLSSDGSTEATLIYNPTKKFDLKNATSRNKAYFFDIPSTKVGEKADGTPIYDNIVNESGITTPGGLLQIPQKGVELFVEFDINNEHYSFQLEVNDKTEFDWRASCRYTYYIVVTHLVPFEIAMTATIEPWVTVQSDDIGTDLEQ